MPVRLMNLETKQPHVKLDLQFTLLLTVRRQSGSGEGTVALSAADTAYTLEPAEPEVKIPDGKNEADVSVEVVLSGPVVAGPTVMGIDGNAIERHGTSVKVLP